MLRTGLFSSWRARPPELAKLRPRRTPYPTIEDIEEQMAAAGIEPRLHAEPRRWPTRWSTRRRRPDRFWILPPSDAIDAQIRAGAESMLDRANPTYLRDVPG